MNIIRWLFGKQIDEVAEIWQQPKEGPKRVFRVRNKPGMTGRDVEQLCSVKFGDVHPDYPEYICTRYDIRPLEDGKTWEAAWIYTNEVVSVQP
jgi:hypothetical protein